MTNSVNMSDLAQLAQKLINDRTQGSDYMLSQVYNMTRQAYETYPEDPVIRQFAFVIEQMMTKRDPHSIITQAEMTNIYNNLVRLSSNTKFKNVLGGLLHGLPVTKTASNDDFINHNRIDAVDTTLDTSEYMDQELVNALNGVFGGDINEQTYNSKAAALGTSMVADELKSLGFNASVKIMGGDKNTLVYNADLETQEGLVTIAIPLDISSGKMLFPSIFVADDKFEDLTAEKISYFIDKKAIAKDFSVPNTNSILRAVNIATGKLRTASDDEFNKDLERFNQSDTNFHISAPELFADRQNHQEPKPYIDTTPEVEMPKELAHLAQDFENDLLEAVSTFGKDAIRRGKGIVLAELAAAGFKNSQVRFGSESNNSVIYLAAIHTPKGPVEIEVPIDMQETANNKYAPLLPSCFAYDGLVEDFTPAKLQRFAINGPSPSSMQVVYSTEHSYMTLPELRDEIVKAAASNDYVTCEMVLATIQDRFEQEDYMNAVADYHYLLMVRSSAGKQDNRRCSKEIAAGKGSIEPRCGHFGVPMSKVVIGEDGECRLKTAIEREKLNPIEESGAAISTSKLYWS